MGKPSSRKSSNTSLNLRASSSSRKTIAMNARKEENLNKRMWSKKNKKIKELFQHLRESSTSLETWRLDSSTDTDNTVIALDDTSIPAAKKRKLSPTKSKESVQRKKKAFNSSIIVINDDDAPSGTPQKKPPMHCSTPIGDTSCTAINDPNVSLIASTKNNNCLIENFNTEVGNLTKEINRNSYQTVDLTGEVEGTIIDLNKTDTQDCILISASNTSLGGDSEVTVLNRLKSTTSEERQIRRVAKGLNGMIAKLDTTSQGKLLELITQNIFSGCNAPKSLKDNLIQDRPRIAETPEDAYIREMFLDKKPSNTSIGSNIYNPERTMKQTGLRTVVIDGSNVAMEHGKGREFSVKGLKICIDYFVNRGHKVRAFVPRFRCKFGKSTEPRLLDALERRGLVVYTPSRELRGRRITSYDDRYIVQYAAAVDGVIVSGDNYRDLLPENPRWRQTIERRVLPFTWIQDMIMFPRDPLGRNGPSLENFLKHEDS